MLEILFTQDSKAEDLFYSASSSPEPRLFFSNYLSGTQGFKLVQDEFQHNFAQMTDEADNNSYMGYPLLELS